MAVLAGMLAHLSPPLNEMEKWARLRLVAPNGVKESGYCERFVHLTYLFPFPSLGSEFHGASAIESARLWADSDFVIDDPEEHAVGDLLYWTVDHGDNGHVAIRIQGNMVAENSIVHWDGSDARGVRPLAALNPPDLAVRLTPELIHNWEVN
jgi:hypothetical protein